MWSPYAVGIKRESSVRETSSGAGRIRTDDIRLAKAALYQLSYGPVVATSWGSWWAWADLNCRPHAYQACALTN